MEKLPFNQEQIKKIAIPAAIVAGVILLAKKFKIFKSKRTY